MGVSPEETAERLDVRSEDLRTLLSGEQGISVDTAMKLSQILGISVEFWLNLQRSYDAVIVSGRNDLY